MTNKPINHPDSEEPFQAMVNGLLIDYTKMERQMDFQEQFGPMESIQLVNSSMDQLKEFLSTTMKKECYLNIKNFPKAI